jgi:uncharacterized Ntn-hydrolase superfamily protein
MVKRGIALRQLGHRAPQLAQRDVVVRAVPGPEHRLVAEEVEQRLAQLLARHPGRVARRRQLRQHVPLHPRVRRLGVELRRDRVELPAVLGHRAEADQPDVGRGGGELRVVPDPHGVRLLPTTLHGGTGGRGARPDRAAVRRRGGPYPAEPSRAASVRAMTFSIVARNTGGTQWGVAVASRFLAAGAVVPAASAGVGAIATQAFANLRYVPDGMALLGQGRPAAEVVEVLTSADDQRSSRQLGVVDAAGRSAAHTGDECIPWAGSRSGDGWTAQGNCLAGVEVVEAMEHAFSTTTDASGPLADRLVAALAAGDAAGGDRRGRQSAALLVVEEGGGYGGGSDVVVDLRVDDHPAPVDELVRLLALHELYFGRPDPDALQPLDGALAAEVDGLLGRVQHDGDRPVADRLLDWMGWQNLEERHVPGSIDPVVLGELRTAAGS